MISFDRPPYRFHYRTAAVIVRPDDGAVLVHRAERDRFWSLPGGRVGWDESAADAVARELREEIGVVAPAVGRLLWVVETFFSDLGLRHHELGMYFAAELTDPADAALYARKEPWAGIEEFCGDGGPPIPLLFAWMPPAALTANAAMPIVPVFLRDALSAGLPDAPVHVVNRENEVGEPAVPQD